MRGLVMTVKNARRHYENKEVGAVYVDTTPKPPPEQELRQAAATLRTVGVLLVPSRDGAQTIDAEPLAAWLEDSADYEYGDPDPNALELARQINRTA